MDYLHRLLYWSSETSKYMEELLDWQMFLQWRKSQIGENPTVQSQSALELSAEFERFRLYEYDLALTWLKCWQRIVRWYEEEIETPRWYVDERETHANFAPAFLDDCAEEARSHVTDSEKKLADAAARLEKSRQEHARIISEYGDSVGGKTAIEFPEKGSPPRPLLSASESLQSSQSSSFSSWQFSLPSPSAQSSQSSRSLQSSQSSKSPECISKNERPLSKDSSAEQRHRRSKKKNVREKGTNFSKMNTDQEALPTFPLNTHHAEDEDDIHMTDAPKDSRPVETVEQSLGVETEDTVMSDFEDSLNHTYSHPSQPRSTSIKNTNYKKSPSPSAHSPTPRKTRSATKLDQALSSKVLKKTKRKPARKVKLFTEQQNMILLNAACTKDSPTNVPSLRRSERLKEKAAASAVTSTPQLNVVQSSQPSQQKQRQEKQSLVQRSQPSRQKKRKTQSHTLELPREPSQPRQKKRKIH